MYGLTTTVAPGEEPITLAEAKRHLRIDHDDEDTLIAMWIQAAREMVEGYTGRRLVDQTVRVRFDCWPADGVIRLPVEPVSAVTSVKYYDADGTEQTLSAILYQTWLDHSPPLVLAAADGTAWPTLQSGKAGAVTVTVTTGYGDAEVVPAMAKVAMLEILGSWDENRADQNVLIARGIPPNARAKLDLLWNGSYS